jgi:hypothetical protein
MPTRTLPTRDVTLADGRRLYYQQEESRRCAEAGKATAVYLTKRGPDGALRILITVDDEPERGEHYHLSGSYPERTPTPDEMMDALKVLIPGGGQFGALTPKRNSQALHGHVVHLVEETPQYLARRARAGQPRDDTTAEVYALGAPSLPIAPTDDAAKRAEQLRMIHDDFGLTPPFTTAALRDALDQVRARRGLPPGWLPTYACTERRGVRGENIVIPYPSNVPKAEQEHAQFHGIAHIMLDHQHLATGVYTTEQEREAEAWADEMMTYSICGDWEDEEDEDEDAP